MPNIRLGPLEIRRLTKTYARQHALALLQIHNTIPYVEWDGTALLAGSSETAQYVDKWKHSRVIVDLRNEIPVGLMVAYLRGPRSIFAAPSLYLHRGALDESVRRTGVGRMLFEHCLYSVALEERWVTLQTNFEDKNLWLIDFYRRLGFEDAGKIYYPNKTDILMVYDRWNEQATL